MSRLLSYVTPGWRRRGALRPRILDVRVAGARLRAALHDLAVFADATLANAHDAQDKGRDRDKVIIQRVPSGPKYQKY